MLGFHSRHLLPASREAAIARPEAETMEPRLLYSADLMPAGLDGESSAPALEVRTLDDTAAARLTPAAEITRPGALVFIDAAVGDADTLLADLRRETPSLEVIRLDADRDGVDQISAALAGREGLEAVHIFSHGAAGQLQLGNTTLDADALQAHAQAIADWGTALTDTADILLYGCDVAGNANGVAFVAALARLTGADVAASTDITGASALGGDWALEYATGTVDTGVAISAELQANWDQRLSVTINGAATTANVSAGAASSGAIAHTTSGTDRLILVAVTFGEDKTDTVQSVTYGGQLLTRAGFQDSSDPVKARVEIWYRVAPLTGSNNVVVNFSTSGGHEGAIVGVMSFNAVDQTTPLGAFFGDKGTGSTQSVTVDSAPTEMVFGALAFSDSNNFNFTVGNPPDQIEQWDLFSGKTNSTASTQPTGAQLSVTTSWSTTVGKPWAAGAVSIRSTASSAAPTISGLAGDTLNYFEDDAPRVIEQGGNVSVGDSDSANFDGGLLHVAIASGRDAAEDVLGIRNQGTAVGQIGVSGSNVTYNAGAGAVTIGTFSGGSGSADLVIAFNANATHAAADALIKNITYVNSDTGHPSNNNRTVRFRLYDGAGGVSATHDATVTVTRVNDAPTASNRIITIDEDSVHNFTAAQFNFADVDGGDSLAQIQITSLVSAGVLELSGVPVMVNDVVLAAQIPNLRFSPQPDAHGAGFYDSFGFRVHDGTTYSAATYTATINVSPKADTPSFTGPTNTDEDVQSGLFQLQRNAVDGAEVTHFKIGAINNGTLYRSDGVTPIASNSFITFAQGNAGVRFTPSLNYNGPASFAFQASTTGNNSDLSTSVNVALTVDPINDAPTVTTSGGALAYTEGQAATAIDAALTVADIDSASLTGATVSITANYANGQDVLAFTNQLGITGSWDAGTGVLTLSGSTSVANYQTALQGVTYHNTASGPATATRTVSFVVDDGAVNSAAATRDIAVTSLSPAQISAAQDTYVNNGSTSNFGNATGLVLNALGSGLGNGRVLLQFDLGAIPGGAAITGVSLQLEATANNNTAARIDVYQVNETDIWVEGNGGTEAANWNDRLPGTPWSTAGIAYQPGIVATLNAPSGLGTHIWTSANLTALVQGWASGTIANTGIMLVSPDSGNATFTYGSSESASAPKLIVSYTSNAAPMATNLSAAESYTEDTPLNLTDIVVSDADSATVTATLTLSVPAAGSLNTATSGAVTSTYNAGTGVWSATGAIADVNTLLAGLTFTPALNYNANFSIATSVSDGVAAPITGSKALTGSAVNDAPVLTTSGSTLAYTENDPATAIDPALNVSDVDSANLTGATVSISANYASGQDVLAFTNQLGITGSWNAGTGVLTLTGSATVANYQTALRSVTYANTSDAPSTSTRTIAFVVNDGAANSNTATRDLSVAAVNDAPQASNLSAPESYTEDTPLNPTDIVVSDADSATVTATLTLSVPAAGSLNTATSGAVTSTYNASTGVWSASGAIADVNTLLAGLTFTPTLNYNANFSIATSVSDSVAAPITGSKALTGSAVNDAPVLTTSGSTLAYTENDPATAIDPALNVSDVDSANLTGATVSISANYASGQDVLAFTNQLGITGSWNAGTGVLTLSGTASIANYQTALRTVTYLNTSDDPSSLNRSISFVVNDGAASSAPASRTVAVTPVVDHLLTVDTTNDVVDGVTTSIDALLANRGADGLISLREAIIAANNTVGLDTINFDLADNDPNRFYYRDNGVAGTLTTIATTTLAEPAITDFDPDYPYAQRSWFRIDLNPAAAELMITSPVLIDGYSQSGASANTLAVGNDASVRIELTSTGADSDRGISVWSGGAGSTIRGLAINGFDQAGIVLEPGANGNTISGNFIGTDITGTRALPNGGDGVQVRSSSNTVGGAELAARNLFSGNSGRGVAFFTAAGTANANTVQNNYIGVDVTGDRGLGNDGFGISAYNVSNSFILGNVIAGNSDTGIWFRTSTATGNTVQGNLIGTGANGTAVIGNAGDGILLDNSANLNTIGGVLAGQGNTIANNSGAGINVLAATGITIRGNSIHGNAGLGIDLAGNGVTANDGNDPDSGPNSLQNYPVITAARVSAGAVEIEGSLNSLASSSFTLDFYASATKDPSNYGEGRRFLGSASVTTAASGSVSFTTPWIGSGAVAGDWITGTATDSAGNTSELSLAVASVPSNNAPMATNLSAAESYTEDTPLNLTDIVISDVDSATVTATLTLSVPAAGSLNIATSGAVTSTYNGGSGVWSASGAIADVNALLAGLTFTPALNSNANFSIATSVSDGVAAPITGSKAFTGSAVNDAPQASGSAVLAAVSEDTVSPAGATVASLFSANFSDPADAGNPAQNQFAGVAVRGQAVDLAEGRWQYSINGGASWSDFGLISDTNAVSLRPTDLLRFQPAANYYGAPNSLSVRLIDNSTTVISGASLNVAGFGGSTPYSATVVSAATSINPVNDAPTVVAVDLGSIAEDGSRLITQAELLAGAGDADGDTLTVSNVVLTAGNGALVDNGNSTWTFTPNANWNGAVGIGFDVGDGTTSSANTASLTALAANDAPTVATIDLGTIAEDTIRLITQAELLAGANDIDGDTLHVSHVVLIAGNGTLLDNGNATWTFTPAADWNGNATLGFDVGDGTVHVANTAALVVSPVNDAPRLGLPGSRTILAGEGAAAMTITVSDAESAATALTVTARSSNPAVLPDAAIVLAGTGAQRTLSILDGHDGAPGSAQIIVEVSDGSAATTGRIRVDATTPIDAPSATSIAPSVPEAVESPVEEDTETQAESAQPLPARIAIAETDDEVNEASAAGPEALAVSLPPADEVLRATLRSSNGATDRSGLPVRLSDADIVSLTYRTAPPSAMLSASGQVGESIREAYIARAFDTLRNNASDETAATQERIGITMVTGAGLTVGYVAWLIRGGVLLTSLLTTMPAWRFLDPLPVLGGVKGDQEGDDDSLEALVAGDAGRNDGEKVEESNAAAPISQARP